VIAGESAAMTTKTSEIDQDIRSWLSHSRQRVEEIYRAEMNRPHSPIPEELVNLSLNHIDRVVGNAAAIAAGEKLDAHLLELAAVLHDCAKLDHTESSSGGVNTWLHHQKGAALAAEIIRKELRGSEDLACRVAQMIERHSDIPFIRRYWEAKGESIPGPVTPEDFALRDADVIDMLWVGGLAKIIQIRQIPGSDFFKEDRGDIRRALISARRSFDESRKCLSSNTARFLAQERVQTVKSFLAVISGVRSLKEFNEHYRLFMTAKEAIKSHPYH
jgi:hypothetical protein